jgi:peptide deformylase
MFYDFHTGDLIMKSLIVLISLISFNTFAHTLTMYPDAPLKIIEIGHPTLTMIAKEIPLEDITSSDTQELIDKMMVTMKKAGGVGLAAPQVNVSKRLFVMKPSWYKKAEAIINPVVEYIDGAGTKTSTEGCLSIPGKQFKVERYRELNLSYYTREGEFRSEHATGFRAIVAQHEYDHLNGILIANFFFPNFVPMPMSKNVPLM